MKRFCSIILAFFIVFTGLTNRVPVYADDVSAQISALETRLGELQAQKNEGVLGFYRSNGTYDTVIDMINKGNELAGREITQIGNEQDATAIPNVLRALDLIEEGNSLRAADEHRQENPLVPLQVSDYLMAMAQIQTNHTAAVEFAHWEGLKEAGYFYFSGENIAAASYPEYDPFEGWYYDEKQAYDAYYEAYPNATAEEVDANAVNYYKEKFAQEISDGSKPDVHSVGHYTNLINPKKENNTKKADLTGLGYSQYAGTGMGHTYAQEFLRSDYPSGGINSNVFDYGTVYSVGEYKNMLQTYITNLDNEIGATEAELERLRESLNPRTADDIQAVNDSLTITLEQTASLEYALLPENGDFANEVITWAVNTESAEYDACVEVDQNGNVTPLAAGIAEVTATIKNGKQAVYHVTVLTEAVTYAYAVIDDAGKMVFFRSAEEYTGAEGTYSDVNGTEYSGSLYKDFENGYETLPWSSDRGRVKVVRVAEGQTIKPVTMGAWFSVSNYLRPGWPPVGIEEFYGEGFDTSNTENMGSLFRSCQKLKYVDLSAFDTFAVADSIGTAQVSGMNDMFSGCENLETVVLGRNFTFKTDTQFPSGLWRNEELGLTRSTEELTQGYNTEWAGTWKKLNPVTSLTLNKTAVSLGPEDEDTLQVTVLPEDATDKTVIWSSSDSSVVSVNDQGVITAVNAGEATITVTAADGSGVSAECAVTVDERVYSLVIHNQESSNDISSVDFDHITEGNAVEPITLVVENTGNSTLSFYDSDSNLSFTDSNGIFGTALNALILHPGESADLIIAVDDPELLSVGTYRNELIIEDDESFVQKRISLQLIVDPVLVSSIVPALGEYELHTGEEVQLSVNVLPENAANKTFSYSSSNTSVAGVDETGLIHANGNGEAVITVSANDGSGVRAEINVIVTTLVNSLSFKKAEITLPAGSIETLQVTVQPATASNKELSFSTSDASVATVDSKGKVKAVKEGSAFITAYATDESGVYATCRVTVTPLIRLNGEVIFNEGEVSYKGKTPYVIYNGNEYRPAVTVTNKENGDVIDPAYYDVTYINNINPGTGRVNVTFKGDYAGKATATFKIYLPATTETTIENTSNGIYLTWAPVEGAKGYVIYRRAWNLVSAGWTKFERWNNTADTEWTDTKVYAGTRYQYGVKAYFDDPMDNYNLGEVGPLKTTVRITTRKLNSVTAGNKQMTVKWTPSKVFTGYQIKYATDAGFTKNVKTVRITDAAKSSEVIKNLVSGQTYYVTIRSYHVFEGMTYYGGWSEARNTKVK
ncbi:MAG: Ig-like domain-containing protein [Solobacterium sp.]|nr:Ig-like domain-containing protein [Solobacterium sp.]